MIPLFLPAALSLAAAGGPTGLDRLPGYETALERSLERAHQLVLERTELWVDHSTWETAWRVSSENYVVRTTASRFVGSDIADSLEAMLGKFQLVLGTQFVPNRKFQIWVFPSIQEYNAYGSNSDEHSSYYGSFYDPTNPERPVATWYTPNTTLLKMFVTHGAVHQFLDQAFPGGRPLWLEEGLAAYFALYWDMNLDWSSARLRQIVDSGSFVPLRRLLAAQALSDFQGAEGFDVRLIELGLFFHYLLHWREETRMDDQAPAPFVDYLRAVLAGRDASSLPFFQLFSRRLDEIQEDLMAFDFGH